MEIVNLRLRAIGRVDALEQPPPAEWAADPSPPELERRYTEEQIIGILGEVEVEGKVLEVCRRHVISRETFYRWRRKYGRWR